MSTVYLGIGSNLGDRRASIEAALARLAALPHTRVVTVSSLIETDPVGVTDQPRFLNAVACLETDLAPHYLLVELQSIEDQLGRVRTRRWGPRTIDLDILLYDELVIETDELTIPHPRMAERRFVLAPLAEVAPEARHPVLGRSAAQLLAALENKSGVEASRHTQEGAEA
jgi:2-amino-4-hydroxy-6-hydroxymethyldihydropteridine diphosphokinase